jgi:type IV pilus assembly protein PilZ
MESNVLDAAVNKINSNSQEASALNNLPRFILAIPDKLSLYTAYMPYIKNGGLFVATPVGIETNYKLAQLVLIDFKLSNNPVISFIGTIVWICPVSATHRVSGIGVELPDDDTSRKLRQNIESTLGQALNSSRATHIL